LTDATKQKRLERAVALVRPKLVTWTCAEPNVQIIFSKFTGFNILVIPCLGATLKDHKFTGLKAAGYTTAG